MRFDNYPAITEYLAIETAKRVDGSQMGFSSQSCSAYVRTEAGEVRFSDHGDRHPAEGRILFNIANLGMEDIEDDCGEFEAVEIYSEWKLAEMIDEAVKALTISA